MHRCRRRIPCFGCEQLRRFFLLLLIGTSATRLQAENGAEAWLRYAPTKPYPGLPSTLVAKRNDGLIGTAQGELVRAVRSMYARTLRVEPQIPNEDVIVLGTAEELGQPALRPDAYRITEVVRNGHHLLTIAGGDERGVLYGAFRLLERFATESTDFSRAEESTPQAAVRWVNQWDNMNGSIERGYAGRSIFFDAGAVRTDLSRAGQYARLLASVGINGCTINNVNADLQMLSPERLAGVARVAKEFRPWGVGLSLAVDLSSPQTVGGLSTFDPLEPAVAEWWQAKVEEIYRQIPDFAGFVVKADSEGRVGPSKYGRTPADAANMLARVLKPHGGIVLYRGFVYNHHLDWRDLKADRARAGYDNFHYLDGKFDSNVIVQIKHGPIDFQAREPVSPLFAGLRQTPEAIELQITQEYTGQQRHLVFLPSMWKQMLDFDLRIGGKPTPLKGLLTGYVGVANVGLDDNWLAHPMAMSNLYGFGQLAWNANTEVASIAERWARLTFGNQPTVVTTVTGMLLDSWQIYEHYTGPLGAGTFTDIIHVHYGPGIESSERNGWGQWHRADHEGIGMDRTVKTGTGYTAQYPPEVAARYESLATTPDELLLFFHHVPYTYQLHSGKTVIQEIYDVHYQGAEEAAGLRKRWQTLQDLVDPERFERTFGLLRYQEGHAIEWRDAICQWFLQTSGIADKQGRAGHYPGRLEAEEMRLTGYEIASVTPWETASFGKAVICRAGPECRAATTYRGSNGLFRIAIQYFDLSNGASDYKLRLNGQSVAAWKADADLPSDAMDGHTAIRHVISGVPLRTNDVIEVVGIASGKEPAPLDYLEVSADERAH